MGAEVRVRVNFPLITHSLRYGYKKAKAEEAKTWMMEYKGTAANDDDPFEQAREEKRERVAKNELQRLRNIARAKKVRRDKLISLLVMDQPH